MTAHSRDSSGWKCPDAETRWCVTVISALLTIWLFRDLLRNCVVRWISEPQYSHGWVIPIMAVILGWSRRDRILSGVCRSGSFGVALCLTGVVGHLIADYLYIEAADAISFLFCVSGVLLTVWGTRFFQGVWPAAVFPVFMLPLPFQIERMLSEPLQLIGASESAYIIQTLGIPAIAAGNTILMGDTRLGVADACSGLRMMMVFLAISTAAVILSRRTRWEKILIFLSAVPIALVSNIVRIVATAVAHQSLGRKMADLVFHDLSGWLMMPLAMLLLYLELRLFDWIFILQEDTVPGLSSAGERPKGHFPGGLFPQKPA